MRSAAGAFALLLGFLAVEIAMVQVPSTLQLDNGGDIAMAILVAVPLLAGGVVAGLFFLIHPRQGRTSDHSGPRPRRRGSASHDLRQLVRLMFAGCAIGIGVHTSPWVTAVAAVAGAGVALSWLRAYRAPLRIGQPPV